MSEAIPMIGDELLVEATRQIGERDWSVNAPSLTHEWRCMLHLKAESQVFSGDTLTVWVYDIHQTQKTILVSNSDFGRKPISDRMRPRYLQSIRCLQNLLSFGLSQEPGDAEAISEVKGMFNRCLRKDQWDWFCVYNAFGSPAMRLARQMAGELTVLARAMRARDFQTAEVALSRLRDLGLEPLLSRATEIISREAPSLSDARPLTNTGHQRSFVREQKKPDQKVLSEYSKEKLDRANLTHERILDILVKFLETHGHSVEQSAYIDAFCRLKSGPAIFEAKSITLENELSQVRHALSQLYEYRFRHKIPEASLWIVLSQRPQQEWLIDYLENDRDIAVIWLEGDRLEGPSATRLLESGSAALKRNQAQNPSIA